MRSVVVNTWNNFWFQKGNAFSLGLFRFLFFSHLFYNFITANFFFQRFFPDFFWQPVGLFQIWDSPPLSTATVGAMEDIWIIALGLSAIGLFTRVSLIVSGVFGFYLMGQGQCYGFPVSYWSIILIPLFTMMFSDCYDSFSLDRLLGLKKKSEDESEKYYWPIRFIQVTFMLVFFFSAWTKLIQTGLDWVTSNNLLYHFLVSYHAPEIGEFARQFKLGPWLAKWPLLCSFLAGAAITIELCAPVALIKSKFRFIPLIALILMQIGNEFLITKGFFGACAAYWAWLPYVDSSYRHGRYHERDWERLCPSGD